jgi:hypothetical protein
MSIEVNPPQKASLIKSASKSNTFNQINNLLCKNKIVYVCIKKMKKTTNTLLLLILLTVIISSCEEKETPAVKRVIQQKLLPSDTLLQFKDVSDFFTTLDYISMFNHTERKNWEDNKKFRSIGMASDEFYFSIDTSIFSKVQDVEEFANLNDEYLKLINVDGEYLLETVLSMNKFRYLANRDHMFQVGDSAYLVLDEVLVHSHFSKINDLKKINDMNYVEYKHSNDFRIDYLQEAKSERYNDNNCGNYKEERVTNNNNRTYLRIASLSLVNGSQKRYWVDFMVRPYKRTAYVWFYCLRTISCKIHCAHDYKVNSNWLRKVNTPFTYQNIYDWCITGEICNETVNSNQAGNHFGGYDCWADTPSTNPNVIIQCNTNIL